MRTEINSLIVKKYGMDAGASVVGIAASKSFGSAPDGFKPTDVLPECLSVIVLGAAFSSEVLKDVDEYTSSRNAMLSAMTNMAKEVAKRIKADGYKTKAISAAGGKWVEGDGRKEQIGHISLKHAAEIAGLGVIGKNYLLTNPQYGNLLWLSAVLTDAELMADEKAQSSMCVNCNKCVEACPVGALDDIASFGKKECSKFFTIEDRKFRIKCYLCRTICPHRFGNIEQERGVMDAVKNIKDNFNNADVLKVFSDCMYMPTQEKLQKCVDDYMANNSISIFGAYKKTQLAGVIAIEEFQDKRAEIRGIAVKADHRKRGIGKQLVQYVFETLALIELNAETDDDAVDFYRNCGFDIEKFQRQGESGEYTRYKCTLCKNSLRI